jgi:hypothetical protein
MGLGLVGIEGDGGLELLARAHRVAQAEQDDAMQITGRGRGGHGQGWVGLQGGEQRCRSGGVLAAPQQAPRQRQAQLGVGSLQRQVAPGILPGPLVRISALLQGRKQQAGRDGGKAGLREAAEVFADDYSSTVQDPDHSAVEERDRSELLYTAPRRRIAWKAADIRLRRP